MKVFDVADPDQYLRHQWKDRSNLIASGKKDSDVCRFSTNAPRARAAEEGSSGESSEKPAI